MTFMEALSNPETRRIIDAIEDIWASMDRGDNSDFHLEHCMDEAVAHLAEFGFHYDPRTA